VPSGLAPYRREVLPRIAEEPVPRDLLAAERSGASQQSKLNKVTGPTLTKAAKLPKNVV
jgi:hypothetical protein